MTAPVEFDLARVNWELEWLKLNPAFYERPATIREFLGPGYLEIASKVRAGVAEALEEIFGVTVQSHSIASYQLAMFTGAIGIGKTTLASIALPYMVHWVLCLKDPQDFFDLLPGSRIAFMQMSTSESQAREVIFGDIFARIKHSPWFINNAPHDEKYTKQIRFPGKDIWILPGDSAETTFEGYNILGGILDEMDSHKIVKEKDYADSGFNTIHARITSRFGKRGLLILIGQMKKANGFAATKYNEFLLNPNAHVTRMTLWESYGWDKYLLPDGTRNSFFYDYKRKSLIPKLAADLLDEEHSQSLIEIPEEYRPDFENKPEQALRDLAGIPPAVSDPFISLVDRIEACRDNWIKRHGDQSPVGTNPTRIEFAEWFQGHDDPRRRTLHIDMAYSAEGDALGMAMGHVEEIITTDEGEKKPLIVIDFMARLKALPGTEIMFSDIRRIIYLKEELGFRLKNITMDGFQSQDTIQQLRKKHFVVEQLSVDKSTLPYEDTREAIYEYRLEFPPYVTLMSKGSDKKIEIAIQEFMELTDDGKKIDHPTKGSKDVTDAIAGVVTTLIGNRSYARGVTSVDAMRRTGHTQPRTDAGHAAPGSLQSMLDAMSGNGLRAPLPPGLGSSGSAIPQHLRPKR
jgi:hypothetical protein